MTDNTLDDAVSGAIPPSNTNQYKTALKGDHVPRNILGVAENEAGSLGTRLLQWLNLRVKNIFLDGVELLAPKGALSGRNTVSSGKERILSSKSDFITADGAADEATIEATTTDLVVNINGEIVTITSDITLTSLSIAPGSNNTCLVNDANLIGDEASKFQGEDETSLTVDTMGSEITNLIGNFVALKHGTNAIIMAYVKSATELNSVSRGLFYDDSNDPIVREVISDDDVLTLYSLGWVFVEDDGVTTEVFYKTPRWKFGEPGSPVSGDYWYDLENLIWKRYSGSVWIDQSRVLIGWVVMNQTNCIASGSVNYFKNWSDLNTINENQLYSVTEIRTDEAQKNMISVNGVVVDFSFDVVKWNIITDLENGYTEASNTWYYLYLSQDGKSIMSPLRPIFKYDLQGYYHPFEMWRHTGQTYNNSGNDLDESFVPLNVSEDQYFIEGLIPSSNSVTPDEQVDVEFGKCKAQDGRTELKLVKETTADLTDNITPGANVSYYLFLYKNLATGNSSIGFADTKTPTPGSANNELLNLDGKKYRIISAYKTDSSSDLRLHEGKNIGNGIIRIRHAWVQTISGLAGSYNAEDVATPNNILCIPLIRLDTAVSSSTSCTIFARKDGVESRIGFHDASNSNTYYSDSIDNITTEDGTIEMYRSPSGTVTGYVNGYEISRNQQL